VSVILFATAAAPPANALIAPIPAIIRGKKPHNLFLSFVLVINILAPFLFSLA